jgi:hypothetical protein
MSGAIAVVTVLAIGLLDRRLQARTTPALTTPGERESRT